MSQGMPPTPLPMAAEAAFGSSDYADLIGARLLDFFEPTSPWQRRLWDVGVCLALGEVVEASQWRGRGVLSDGAVKWLARDVSRIAGRDPALGEAAVRKHLNETLRTSLEDGSRHVRRLTELSEMVSVGYLDRWLEQLQHPQGPSVERLARAIAAHLLDLDYSMSFLRAWIRGHIRESSTLGDMVADAARLATQPMQTFSVLVPFRSVPGARTSLTSRESTWRDASAIARWFARNAVSVPGVRQVGGFEYSVRARDPFGAVLVAAERVDRLMSRATLARAGGAAPEPLGFACVAGSTRLFTLNLASRGAFVLSLVAESRLYDVDDRSDLDDALELASVLNLGSPGPAIASGWAAIEALLVSPRDPEDAKLGRGAVAADRLASLVACSWPRADLTSLSYKHAPAVPDLISKRLAAAGTNQERSRIIAGALAGGASLAVKRASDRAAAARMARLVKAERATLRDVEAHVRSAMRRLYRQRNIVMHGGSTGTLARDATLRTCAPLVGAGLDRIAHARIARGEGALQVADRAQLSLDLVGTRGGPDICDLLE